jgi:RecA-family ATPase
MRTKAFPLVPDWLFDIRENAETAGPVDLKSPLPAPGIASDLVKAKAQQALETVATQLAETRTKRGTATFKHAAVMGGWAAKGAIARETVWDELEKAARKNGHFKQDLPDLARSFDRGFRTGYLQAIAEGHVVYLPNQQPPQSQSSPPSGLGEFPPSLKTTQPGLNGTCAPSAGLKAFQVDELLSTPAPKRKWRVNPLVPQAEVTLLAGDGGGGKSTICLQLGMAGVGEKVWFGFTVEPCNVLYVSAEDPKDELHYRLEQINRHLQIPSDKLARFKIIDLSGADATTLAAFDKNGEIRKTALFDEVERIAAEHDAGLVILDAAADFFGGNENERREVRAFIGLLRGLAMRLDAAVMVIAHPSVDGMRSGRGYSGSTHWNNSVRSRLTFTDEPTDEKTPPGLEVKVLELAKSNRARRGEKIRMMWNDGQFELLAPGASGSPDADRQAKEVFLQLLKKLQTQGILVVPESGRNYAPAVMAERAGGKDIGKAWLKRAMHALLDDGLIAVEKETTGPPSKRRRFLTVKETAGAIPRLVLPSTLGPGGGGASQGALRSPRGGRGDDAAGDRRRSKLDRIPIGGRSGSRS